MRELPRRVSRAYRLLALLLVCDGLAGPRLLGDLKIGLPPGPPLEWLNELPYPDLDVYAPVIDASLDLQGPRPSPQKPCHRGSGPFPSCLPLRGLSAWKGPCASNTWPDSTPMIRARILTRDIVTHMHWTRWRRNDIPPKELGYPPRTRSDLHWTVVAAFLLPTFYPARTSLSETTHYLLLIGPPVLDVLPTPDWGMSIARRLNSYLRDNIVAAPRRLQCKGT